jgi:hypothetical protein
MLEAGFTGARRTAAGPDGGIDAISHEAVGQAKFHPSQKVTVDAIRSLVGSRLEHKREFALFSHYGPGNTEGVLSAARTLEVLCYSYDPDRQWFLRVKQPNIPEIAVSHSKPPVALHAPQGREHFGIIPTGANVRRLEPPKANGDGQPRPTMPPPTVIVPT